MTGHAYYVQSVDTANGTVTVVNLWGSAYAPITLSYADFQDSFEHDLHERGATVSGSWTRCPGRGARRAAVTSALVLAG